MLKISRREFVIGSAALATAPRWRLRESFTFGMIADVHQDVMHDGVERLTAFIEAMKEQEVDFIMQLGDFCVPKPENQPFMDAWNGFPGPKYHVLGNHDTDGGFSQEQTQEFWSMPDQTYSFDHKGMHFVVLDGNDLHEGRPPGYPRHVGQEQRSWLVKDLKGTELPTVVFCHQSLQEGEGGLDNTLEMQALLENANEEAGWTKVFASLCGHHHIDQLVLINGIQYVQINSASYHWLGGDYRRARYSPAIEESHPYISYTSPYEGPLWATCEVHADGRFDIVGMKTDWVKPSMWDIGYPPDANDYVTPETCVPEIRNRELRFKD
ncbi:MAG: metallophosphoesterase family protein [Armatimonadetes bacterium]|nr:metallophosphoesterase family protein [Armatimonadota bacterium]